jgi:serine phosphatase RsbU (regulator of sigma subunit)
VVGATLRIISESFDTPGETDQIATLNEEIASLREEVRNLRKRDEVVHFYLHRIDEELRLAARLQQDFLPKNLPCVGSARFNALFRPAGYVSGDLYDVFRLDENHVGFYLADAIGHGVPSALLTMFLRTSLVSKEINGGTYRILPPGEALARLNTAFASQNFSQTTFATACYGVINAITGEVQLSRAGHPLPILIPANSQEWTALDCGGGPLLGVFPEAEFDTRTFQLNPGDRLFIHSDGTDDVQLHQGLGEVGSILCRLVAKRDTASALAQLTIELDRQGGSLAPKDDLTIIAVEMEAGQ